MLFHHLLKGVDVPDDEGLLVDNLCRNHGNIGEIYSQVSFDVKKGQCFGLLGKDRILCLINIIVNYVY